MPKKAKRLSTLIGPEETQDRLGAGDPDIGGICYDSRLLRPGELFCALTGFHVDGRQFIEEALRRGAAAVLYAGSEPTIPAAITHRAVLLRVADVRRALSRVSARLFDHPSRKLPVVGVTGTDGKSTTVWFISQLLNELGAPNGVIATIGDSVGGPLRPNRLHYSTPEAPHIHGLLDEMVDNGCHYALLEATSHGLSRRTCRLCDVEFDAALFTNLEHEHVDFHGSLERYRDDKANLFRVLDRVSNRTMEPFGVVNADSEASRYMRSRTTATIHDYSLIATSNAEVRADTIATDLMGSRFTLIAGEERLPVEIDAPGAFNVANCLAALSTTHWLTGADYAALAQAARRLRLPDGRMQIVCAPPHTPFRVLIDYAHTPAAFAMLLPLARRHTGGRLIVLFGSAGERDREKRPMQGALGARYADLIILTDEDPRGESSRRIIEQIAAGAQKAHPKPMIIPDRKRAITQAILMAGDDDTVLLLGKGHEQSIIYADGARPWDELAVAREALSRAGFDLR